MPDFEVTGLVTFTVRNVKDESKATAAVHDLEESIVTSELELRSPITATAIEIHRVDQIERPKRKR